jgi:hypothetical protein
MDYKAIEFKLDDLAESTGVFSGYASVYNGRDQGGDKMMPEAFTKSLAGYAAKNRMPKMLWQHDPSQPVGVWTSMASDAHGLKMEGRLLLDLPKAKEINILMKAGAVDGLSIGYKAIDYDFIKEGTLRTRVLKEVELWETSIVTFPMDTNAGVTDVKQLQSVRDVERLLRKAGVPGGFAKLVALHGYEEAAKRVDEDFCDEDLDEAKVSALLLNLKKLKESFNA